MKKIFIYLSAILLLSSCSSGLSDCNEFPYQLQFFGETYCEETLEIPCEHLVYVTVIDENENCVAYCDSIIMTTSQTIDLIIPIGAHTLRVIDQQNNIVKERDLSQIVSPINCDGGASGSYLYIPFHPDSL